MQKSEQLSVRWDDFQQNVRASFKELREDREFADVTLVCQDGKQFEVHKNILAASSSFFLDIFRTWKHPHPLVYLSGMKSQILVSVVDFIYYGEASVYQEDMEDFLAVAEELALKGLANIKETFKNSGYICKFPLTSGFDSLSNAYSGTQFAFEPIFFTPPIGMRSNFYIRHAILLCIEGVFLTVQLALLLYSMCQ